MIKIGLTGGTGAGKSTVGNVFRQLGAEYIDADAVYHELLDTDAEMLANLRARFGDAVFADGRLSRKALRDVVFAGDDAAARECARRDLETITHPRVVREILRRAESCGRTAAVIDAIALFESGLSDVCDIVVGVVAPPETRKSRIISRDGLTPDEAARRIAAQKPDSFYRERCDFIIENSGDTAAVERTAAELFKRITT